MESEMMMKLYEKPDILRVDNLLDPNEITW